MYKALVVGLSAALVSVFTLGGCATTQQLDPVVFPIEATPGYDDGFDATRLTIHRGDLSGIVTFEQMIDDLRDAEVILVGEMHGHEPSLDFIATTFDRLIQENPSLALSMEFYERDQQIPLDDYVRGIIDYEQFVKLARRNDGNNPIGHLRMVELCKQHNRPVIAANAPRRYTSIARKEGFEGYRKLNDRQMRLVEVPKGLPSGSYAERFRDAMSGMAAHGGEEMINGFLRSQTVWDQTMAVSVADLHARGSSVFHVVGHFHVDHGTVPGGSAMTDAIRDRIGTGAKLRSIVMHASDKQIENMSVTAQDAGNESELYPGPAADYILYFSESTD
ncbi:MAG: ChaN family lipoprotein [Phycisphaerales bacterium]|nr:ChaN family lipoprotein [Phycisphaerales bacterium]